MDAGSSTEARAITAVKANSFGVWSVGLDIKLALF
jgi:hypothetical protein